MNVLSLFDGMSCGQIALDRIGIKVDKYFASEVDKYAIKVAQKNYPNTIQLGSVEFVTQSMINNKIDLLIGGSPCQGFSFAGKQLNFQDPRSKLFFEFVRLLKECKPKYFLLENVRMKKEYQDVISDYLGVEPIAINSRLVSAQNRYRLYWTNIPNINQPSDKGVLLKDILEDDSRIVGRIVNRRLDSNGTRKDYDKDIPYKEMLEPRDDFKSGTITTVTKDNVVLIKEATVKGYLEVKPGECVDLTQPNSKTRRGRYMEHKSNCLTTSHQFSKIICNVNPSGRGMNGNVYNIENDKSPTLTTNKGEGIKIGGSKEYGNFYYRKLTPVECERLQTVPDNYTNCVSNSQRYKMLGNGWTVDVITHILKNIIDV